MDTYPHILLFDGVCNLCNRLVQFIIKRDRTGKFKFASLQSVTGQSLLRNSKLPTQDLDSIVYLEEERFYIKSTAMLHVLKELGGVWKGLYGFIIFPKFIRDFVYDMVAKTRYKIWGKRDTCMIPTPGIKQRFLE